MLSAPHTTIASLALCGTLFPAASAQQPQTPQLQQPQWRDLRVVEPGVGDLGPVGISTRLLPVDLRQPSGFDRVYRVPGSSRGVGTFPGSDSSERLARVDGAITAVFSRSEYDQTKHGVRAAIPAGTVFYIGNSPLLDLPDTTAPHERSVNAVSYLATEPALSLASAAQPARAAARMADFRVHAGEEERYASEPRPLKADDPAPPANVFTDEQFRRTRIRALLMAAASRGE